MKRRCTKCKGSGQYRHCITPWDSNPKTSVFIMEKCYRCNGSGKEPKAIK